MYPNLYYFFYDVFGIEIGFLKAIQSFGFFVAISFILGAYFFSKELKRKEDEGLLKPTKEKVKKGEPASVAEMVISGFIGFLLGYKLLYIGLNFSEFTENTQAYILSAKGNLLGGLIGGAIGAYLKYIEKKKEKLAKPEIVENTVHPYQLVGNMTLIAAAAGLLGAKLFHNLENWNAFIKDPIGQLLSFSGLTMYGGLICGGAAVILYARKKGITIPHLIDACAPALMIAYGVGRLGCQVSGDGDWGIPNSAYVTDMTGTLQAAAPPDFAGVVNAESAYFITNFKTADPDSVPQINAPAPSWAPRWMFAMNYYHNVNTEGIGIAGCTWGDYCTALPTAVFPTPIYEAVMCIGLFFALWAVRRRVNVPGVLFSIYLVLNGLERFTIEQIRVNTTLFMIGDYKVTQAMFIALILVMLGVAGIIYFRRNRNKYSVTSTTS